ncbi:hypothetical protein B0H13DRAFT_1896491 [Mycena leptocephala]|nr:hypothetical protein B0H13DRAFT_1896491 [Mycena leptocephala]
MFASTAAQQHMAHTARIRASCNESRRVIWTKRAGKKDKREFELKLSVEPLLCLCSLDLQRRCNDDEESVNDLAIRFTVERDLGDSYQQMLNQMREGQKRELHDRWFKADSGGKQPHMLLTRVCELYTSCISQRWVAELACKELKAHEIGVDNGTGRGVEGVWEIDGEGDELAALWMDGRVDTYLIYVCCQFRGPSKLETWRQTDRRRREAKAQYS